jgi:rod shape-determining protein MreD
MISSAMKYIVSFILLLAADILVISKLNLSFFLNPHIYIMFIILLPMFTDRHVLMLTAFFMGLIVDQFLGTGGIHAASALIMAYLRQVLLVAFAPRDGYGKDDFLTIDKFGLVNFLMYCGFMVLIFHFSLFFIELFSFRNILITLVRTIASGGLSLLLILSIHLLLSRKPTSK